MSRHLCLWLAFGATAGTALAQQPVFRCGQEYTNAPLDASRCERVASQSITVIPGTRVTAPALPWPRADRHAPAAPVQPAGSSASVGAGQGQRDDMARSILEAELEQTRQRHAQLLDEYRQGAPERLPQEAGQADKYQERVARLKAALERSQRDIDSLQRELARRPVNSAAR